MNKLMKFKSGKILLSVILIIFTIMTNSIGVSAEQLEIKTELPQSVNIGNSFSVVFSADRNTNIKAIRIKVGYNSDYISFKNIENIQSGEINYNSKKGTVDIIILFDSTLKSGNVFKLNLTAKTGNYSSKQNITFEILEAVDKDLKDVSVNITGSANIEIIKKGDQSSQKSTDSSAKSSTTSSKKSTSSAASKSSNASKSNVNSSANTSYKTNSTSKSSKASSSRANSSVSKKENSSTADDETEYNDINEASEQDIENEDSEAYKDNTTSISQFGSEDIGNLNLKESKAKYIFAGVGGTLSVMGILFAAFRLGQLSKRKPESDKIFPKDDNENKW